MCHYDVTLFHWLVVVASVGELTNSDKPSLMTISVSVPLARQLPGKLPGLVDDL